jgi:hypothetical protein
MSSGTYDSWRCPTCSKPITSMPTASCWCRKSEYPTLCRTSTAVNSCGISCGNDRDCLHACSQICHAGPCAPCGVCIPNLPTAALQGSVGDANAVAVEPPAAVTVLTLQARTQRAFDHASSRISMDMLKLLLLFIMLCMNSSCTFWVYMHIMLYARPYQNPFFANSSIFRIVYVVPFLVTQPVIIALNVLSLKPLWESYYWAAAFLEGFFGIEQEEMGFSLRRKFRRILRLFAEMLLFCVSVAIVVGILVA